LTGFELHGVHKSYGASTPVLTGIDLDIASGELTAILGPSGSGKTTLLRVIAGFERVDAGTVAIDGSIVDDGRRFTPPERRRIGYVPQEGALFPHLTVAGNIGFGLPRRARTPGRIAELLDLIGLAPLGRRYPHELSGGQQQRVALARALAINPKLVLLDEPFSSLDAALRASVRADVVRVLRTAGATALLVTHDQDEALSMADRVAVLRNGVIAQVGTPQDLYEHPADLDIARFLGEANVVEGVASRGAAKTVLGTIAVRPITDGRIPDGPVTVMVRPEHIKITVGMTDQGVCGRVEELHYFGHDTIMTVRPADGSGIVRVRVVGTHPVTAGDDVTVTVDGTASAWAL
jgi:iron(III) transport system ATP-binding protein